ncbi:hypothetical protein KX729_01425 [Rhizobium sp. XQZ8]|uniref:hypothetical protein n=1 Tax=Rhizobium populisoli TaxID=2859785 RepID=UPI001CA52616|nr:hypothetical protein [Rhizobium populisoli]MBW6420100.1 hypothetical protein [Rhizobium populisoli]
MEKIQFIAAASALALFFVATSGSAAERPLIWQPTKNSDTSYSIRLGMQLPTRLEAEAGISFGMNATKGGAPIDTPIRFWSSFVTSKVKTTVSEMRRGVGLDFDGNTGSAAISMNYYEKEFATPSLDLERNSSYTMRYDGVSGEWAGIDANQSVRLTHGSTGTSLMGRASASDSFATIGAGIGLEQQIGEYMTVTGSLDSSMDASDPVTSVKARYSFTW